MKRNIQDAIKDSAERYGLEYKGGGIAMTNENSTIVHEGITYRKVSRKANVGEKVLIVDSFGSFGKYENGDIFTVDRTSFDGGVEVDKAAYESQNPDGFIEKAEYVTLEPIAEPSDLPLTEADVRNNPRQVIDLIANLARRLTLLEGEHQALEERHVRLSDNIPGIVLGIDERINRLGDSVEQAITAVARNVETWAQDYENLKYELAKVDERTQPYQVAHDIFVKIAGGLNGRNLTAEERREL
jgi:hypothetical protein